MGFKGYDQSVREQGGALEQLHSPLNTEEKQKLCKCNATCPDVNLYSEVEVVEVEVDFKLSMEKK